jgi:hypothetical protein
MSQPNCIGNYKPGICADCRKETRWECLEATRLSELQEANRLKRKQLGEVSPEMKHLLRLGYPARVLGE